MQAYQIYFPARIFLKHTFQGSNSKTSMFSQPWQQMQIFPSRSTHSVQQHQKKMMAKSHGIFATVTLLQLVFSYSWPMVWFCNSRVVLCSSKSEIATEGKHQSKSLPTCYGIDDLGEGLKWRTLISFKNLFGFLPPKIYILPVPWQILCSFSLHWKMRQFSVGILMRQHLIFFWYSAPLAGNKLEKDTYMVLPHLELTWTIQLSMIEKLSLELRTCPQNIDFIIITSLISIFIANHNNHHHVFLGLPNYYTLSNKRTGTN